jgi:VWA domain-containing protein
MGALLAVAVVLVVSTLVVALEIQRRQSSFLSRGGATRNALRFVVGPFPLSVAIHVLIAILLIITVHESRGRELIMVNLEAGGGGGEGTEMQDLDMPEIPMPDIAPPTEQPVSANISGAVTLADRYARASTGIGTGLGDGIGTGRGPGIGAGFGGYIGTLRRNGLDVALVIDGTGSMQYVIADVKAHMRALVAAIHRLVPTARVGIVVYGGKNEPIEFEPLTLSPPRLETFLDRIQAKGGGEWEEDVLGGTQAAVNKLDWRAYAKKVIVLVADSPPEKSDFPRMVELVRRFRAQNGVVNAIDLTGLEHERFEREFEEKVHGIRGDRRETGSASNQAPLPSFYRQTQIAYEFLTHEGGGEMESLASNDQLNQEVMILAFGSRWRDLLAAFAKR